VMWIIHVQIMYAAKHTSSRVISMVGGKHIPVICVRNHSHSQVIWG